MISVKLISLACSISFCCRIKIRIKRTGIISRNKKKAMIASPLNKNYFSPSSSGMFPFNSQIVNNKIAILETSIKE
jgi:hypothetical protein